MLSTTTVEQGVTLTVDPGSVVKMSGNLTIRGALQVNGAEASRVIFTSRYDDSVGGDTNSDAGATGPAPGDWGAIYFGPTSGTSLIEYATIKFADHYAQTRDAAARTDYETLLTDLETTFAQKTTAFLSNNRSDLDVEIAVLRDRLKLDH